jgi:hypothetical protein
LPSESGVAGDEDLTGELDDEVDDVAAFGLTGVATVGLEVFKPVIFDDDEDDDDGNDGKLITGDNSDDIDLYNRGATGIREIIFKEPLNNRLAIDDDLDDDDTVDVDGEEDAGIVVAFW